jgi:hypothetical protein
MKKSILVGVLLSFVSVTAYAGLFDLSEFKKIDNPNQPIEIILEVPGQTQTQLFSTVKAWIAEHHIAEITDTDKEAGRIISEGYVESSVERDAFALRIDTKNDKARMTFTNFYFRQLFTTGGTSHGVYNQHDLNKATAIAHQVSDDFSKYVTKKVTSDKW